MSLAKIRFYEGARGKCVKTEIVHIFPPFDYCMTL